jgi:hypothetical protein
MRRVDAQERVPNALERVPLEFHLNTKKEHIIGKI